jgi:hypothetical protein
MAKADLNAKLNLDSTAFERGVQRSQKAVGKMQKAVVGAANSLAKMGLASASAAVLLLSRNAINLGSYLSDVAISTGFATEQFQVFRGALIDAGGKAESMEKAITIMQKAVVQGSEGLTTYVRAFERLGLNVDDLRKMKPEDQFQAIGKAIAGAEDQQGALTAAIEIFGQRNAPRLIEVFKRLDKEGYGKMAEDIEKTYGIMTAETQKALDRAADQIERFKNKATIKVGELIAGEAGNAALKELGFRVMGVAASFGGKLIDGLTSVGQLIVAGLGGSFDFVADRFKATMESAIDSMRIKVGELLLTLSINNPLVSDEKFAAMADAQRALEKEIAIKRKSSDEKQQKSWSDFFEDAIPDPTDYAGEMSKYWEDMADDQRKILEESRAKENSPEPSQSMASNGDKNGNITGETSPNADTSSDSTTDGGRKKSGIQTGRIQTSQIGDGSMAARMEARERAAGLFLAGNDTMSGRRARGATGATSDAAAATGANGAMSKDQLIREIAQSVKVIESTMTE